jgi:hypothetical protein
MSRVKNMKTMVRSHLATAVVTALATALVVGGVSWASIPDSSGVIHGCYKTAGSAHALKIIDSAKTATCPKGNTALNWDGALPIGAATGAATGGTQSSNCIVGQILLYAGNEFPDNELAANGQSLTITSYEPLFELIGTTYGGTGTTFNLPNLEGLAPNNMTYTVCVQGVFP